MDCIAASSGENVSAMRISTKLPSDGGANAVRREIDRRIDLCDVVLLQPGPVILPKSLAYTLSEPSLRHLAGFLAIQPRMLDEASS